MFFGKGDTSQLEDDEQHTLAHLRRMVETGHLVGLDPKQSALALRAIDFYDQWESALRFGKSVRNTGILIGGGLLFWWATGGENFIIDFIRSAVGE